MLSPEACQEKCQQNDDCAGFAYQYDENGGNYYHECYVKQGYATVRPSRRAPGTLATAEPAHP